MNRILPHASGLLSFVLLTGFFTGSCTKVRTTYFDVDCDQATNVHYFLAEIPHVRDIEKMQIHISLLEGDEPVEEEHSLDLEEQQATDLWTLELSYDNTSKVSEPNQTTLFRCDTPRLVEFEGFYDDGTFIKLAEIAYFHQD